jgi:hypothetical protein
MHALPELQDAVADAVLGSGVIAGLDETRLSGEVATDIYRNNVRVGVLNALRGAFPAVCALLGHECFEGLVERYRIAHPSRSGDLHELGAALPAFLAKVPEFDALGYLADVARLEWAQRSALVAADAETFDFSGLGGVAEADFGRLHFRLAPASFVLQSAWPVYGIWRLARAAADGDESESEPPDMSSGGECVLVYRDGADRVGTERLSQGGFRFLSALHEGADFDAACEQAWQVESELDVGACLRHLVAEGVIDAWRA